MSTRASLAERWPIVVLAVCVVGVLLLYGDYAITWDETVQATYGEKVLDYFLSGFQDRSYSDYHDLRYYGPPFELTSAAIHRLLGLEPFAVRHLLNGWVAVLAIPAVIGLGRLLGGQRIAFFSCLALVSLPRFMGHAFNNSKDIPLACATCWALYAFVRLLALGRFDWRAILGAAAAVGLAMAVRPGAVFLFVLCALIAGFWCTQRFREVALDAGSRQVGSVLARLGVAVVLSWLIMVCFWPFAHEAPLRNPVAAMAKARAFDFVVPVLFRGEFVDSDSLPRYYLPWFLLITTPINLLALALAGCARGCFVAARSWRSKRTLVLFSVQLWLFFPLTYFVLFTPNIYNGMRHFLFVLPAVAFLAGLGAEGIRRLLIFKLSDGASMTICAILLLSHTPALVTLHPYQATYFNSIAGPRPTLHQSYDVDYWLSAYKEAAAWINERQRASDRPLSIIVYGNEYAKNCALYYLDEGVEARVMLPPPTEMNLPDDVDYYLGSPHQGYHQAYRAERLVHSIERRGVLLAVIKERRGRGLVPAARDPDDP